VTQYLFKLCPPRTNSAPSDQSATNRKTDIQTPHYRTYSWHAQLVSSKLCTMIEDIVPIIKGAIIFRPNA